MNHFMLRKIFLAHYTVYMYSFTMFDLCIQVCTRNNNSHDEATRHAPHTCTPRIKKAETFRKSQTLGRRARHCILDILKITLSLSHLLSELDVSVLWKAGLLIIPIHWRQIEGEVDRKLARVRNLHILGSNCLLCIIIFQLNFNENFVYFYDFIPHYLSIFNKCFTKKLHWKWESSLFSRSLTSLFQFSSICPSFGLTSTQPFVFPCHIFSNSLILSPAQLFFTNFSASSSRFYRNMATIRWGQTAPSSSLIIPRVAQSFGILELWEAPNYANRQQHESRELNVCYILFPSQKDRKELVQNKLYSDILFRNIFNTELVNIILDVSLLRTIIGTNEVEEVL